jgi:hypothetical protein
VVTTQPYAGTRALQHIERLVNDVGTYQDIAATAGAAYSVSGWVKTSNITSAGAGFVVVWMDSAGLALRRDYSSKVNGTRPWTPLSLSLTAPAGARKLRLRFYTTNHWSGSGTIWFDEARVVAAGSSGSTSAPMPSTSQTPPAPVGSNLLADSGFESNGTGWQWATGAGRSVVSTQPHSGAKVLQHVEKSVNQLGSFQNLAAIPGKTYDVSGWIRTQGVGGTGAGVQVVWLNSSNGTLRIDNSRKVTGTQPWTQVSLTLTAPSGASILRFRFFTAYRPTGTGTIWYDDAQVIPR